MIRTRYIKPRGGLPYTVTRTRARITLARIAPDGQFQHRVMMGIDDVYAIADALIDLAEGDAAT